MFPASSLTSEYPHPSPRNSKYLCDRVYCLSQKGNNIILMGSPGAGKTTIGRMLGDQLRKEVVDVDDDVLEKVWGMTVADKVSYK